MVRQFLRKLYRPIAVSPIRLQLTKALARVLSEV